MSKPDAAGSSPASTDMGAMTAPVGTGPAVPSSGAWTRVAAGACVLTAVACAVGSWVLIPAIRDAGTGMADVVDAAVIPLAIVVLTVIGAVVVVRGRSRRYGWVLLAAGIVNSPLALASSYAYYALVIVPDQDLPLGQFAGWVQDLWMLQLMFSLVLIPALFPDGYPVARWRRPLRVAVGGWLILTTVFMLTDRALTGWFESVAVPPDNPMGLVPVPMDVINFAWVITVLASVVVGFGSVVTRWRTADTEMRQRLKWVLLALAVGGVVAFIFLVVTLLVEVAGLDLEPGLPLSLLSNAALVFLVLAMGFGVLRFRLYEVDLAVNRTIVYGIMTGLVVVAYVLVVVGVGALLREGTDLVLSLFATGLVAAAFNPVRNRVQRAVNQAMFGRRDDPYAVLSELGRLLARSGDPAATVQGLVETVAEAMKLPAVAFDLETDGGWVTWASIGDLTPGAESVEMHHRGELVGRLVASRRSVNESLGSGDLRLLMDVANQTAALAHAMRLTLALQRSREQLVVAREEERRRLRRDLHDGLGPSLASQTFHLDAVLAVLGDDQPEAHDLVTSIKRQNQRLVADIRRLVYELRPPALDELGLVGALAAHAGQLDRSGALAIDVEAPEPIGDLPAAVEVAAYHIAREAITNVVRHAEASVCRVSVIREADALRVSVVDDGVGVRAVTEPGIGLTSMRERADELNGTVAVDGRAGRGTEVAVVIPLSDQEAAAPIVTGRAATSTSVAHD